MANTEQAGPRNWMEIEWPLAVLFGSALTAFVRGAAPPESSRIAGYLEGETCVTDRRVGVLCAYPYPLEEASSLEFVLWALRSTLCS